MTTVIRSLFAWEALDSRGVPTVACRVTLQDGVFATARVPSGSTSAPGETIELRDGGKRYGGKGVLDAVASVNQVIGPALVGRVASDQADVDSQIEELDGSSDLSRLGSNATMAVSVAVAQAAALSRGVPLYEWIGRPASPVIPTPLVNLMFGDAHDHELQHLMCVPRRSSISEAIEMAWSIRESLRGVLRNGDGEGRVVGNSNAGKGASIGSASRALEATADAVERAGLTLGTDAALAFDLAAYRYKKGVHYSLPFEGVDLMPEQLLALLVSWSERFPIAAMEDPFDSSDSDWWRELTRSVSSDTLVISDRLSATSLVKLREVAEAQAANSVLVKPNQAGTVSRTRAFVEAAKHEGVTAVMGSRAGSTEDGWSADMSMAWDLGYLKAGALTSSDRTAKWNRLLEAEAHGVPYKDR